MCGMVLKIVYLEITRMLSLNGKDKNICFETKEKTIIQLCKSVSICMSAPPASIATSGWSDAELGTSDCTGCQITRRSIWDQTGVYGCKGLVHHQCIIWLVSGVGWYVDDVHGTWRENYRYQQAGFICIQPLNRTDRRGWWGARRAWIDGDMGPW